MKVSNYCAIELMKEQLHTRNMTCGAILTHTFFETQAFKTKK